MISHAIDAERIKLLSTRSPYWCVGIVVVLGILISVLIGVLSASTSTSDTSDLRDPSFFAIGVSQIGVIVLMIMAVLAVTSEFRFGTIRTTFQAIPRREVVLGAKAIVYGGLSGVVTLVLAVVAIVLGKALAGDAGSSIDLTGSEAVRQYWGIPVYAVLCVLIGLGIGALVRQSAGAIVILLIWSLALEGIIGAIPKVSAIGPYLPFNNATHFISESAVGDSIDFPWGPYGSLLYFAVWAIAIFAGGVVVTMRRDA
ncbi:ABC transporter permease [Williamsia deligens]|uniref:ABC transporter permease n=1 Tax=Williamsia deligens TaxID=321325 RepID=A0ABW3G665_9NOCA|nr:ABC transporter permease [Williamsia deligens]MCP2193188.1 ABC-2 type transport system permease protein [Williamsia deligens]